MACGVHKVFGAPGFGAATLGRALGHFTFFLIGLKRILFNCQYFSKASRAPPRTRV